MLLEVFHDLFGVKVRGEVARRIIARMRVGHVARQNPVWQALTGRPGIVVFHGPQAYVSPNWYPSKREHHKVVPTWNYAIVHVHGIARAIQDRSRLREIVQALTGIHEAAQPVPWQVGDAPADFIATMLDAIVGIEIPIDSIEGKWKMSQNKEEAARLLDISLATLYRRLAEDGE